MGKLLGRVQGELGRDGILHRTLDHLRAEPILIVGEPLARVGLIEHGEELLDVHATISRPRVPMRALLPMARRGPSRAGMLVMRSSAAHSDPLTFATFAPSCDHIRRRGLYLWAP